NTPVSDTLVSDTSSRNIRSGPNTTKRDFSVTHPGPDKPPSSSAPVRIYGGNETLYMDGQVISEWSVITRKVVGGPQYLVTTMPLLTNPKGKEVTVGFLSHNEPVGTIVDYDEESLTVLIKLYPNVDFRNYSSTTPTIGLVWNISQLASGDDCIFYSDHKNGKYTSLKHLAVKATIRDGLGKTRVYNNLIETELVSGKKGILFSGNQTLFSDNTTAIGFLIGGTSSVSYFYPLSDVLNKFDIGLTESYRSKD
ncbi:MAG: hypothetical protein ABIN13_04335, partial [Mucilaginibacter sp.]